MSRTQRQRGKPRRMPGDPGRAETLARMIRVNQAGEYGAKRIYEGQLAVLGDSRDGPVLREMAAVEERHLQTFDDLMVRRRVRPTALGPLWHLAGYALGAGTALMGREAAMACTVAVEEVIEEHYARQAEALAEEDDAELAGIVEKFGAEEADHRETAIEHDARKAPGYEPLTAAIRAGSRLAIWLSERV